MQLVGTHAHMQIHDIIHELLWSYTTIRLGVDVILDVCHFAKK